MWRSAFLLWKPVNSGSHSGRICIPSTPLISLSSGSALAALRTPTSPQFSSFIIKFLVKSARAPPFFASIEWLKFYPCHLTPYLRFNTRFLFNKSTSVASTSYCSVARFSFTCLVFYYFFTTFLLSFSFCLHYSALSALALFWFYL